MPSELKSIPPIPTATNPLVDPRNGLVDPQSWYLYLKRLGDHVAEVEKRLDASENQLAAHETRISDLETP